MGSVLGEETSLKYFCPTLNIWCIWEDKRAEMNLIGDTIIESVGVRLLAGTKLFSVLHSIHTGPELHRDPNLMSTGRII
jgi:hypothetical protein